MKKKSQKLIHFIEGLHEFIVTNPQFRKRTKGKSEAQIQSEIRPLIIKYLERYFEEAKYTDPVARANRSFYWEGQEGRYGKERRTTFGTRNYPDFIITDPYLIALEYKQSESGSVVKHGIGQSIMHTLCEDFHFVYFLFHDQTSDKRIERSIEEPIESFVIDKMWQDFNVYIKFV